MTRDKQPVLCQQWTEYWDGHIVGSFGYSLHLTEEDWCWYVTRHRMHQTQELGPEPMGECEDPTGEPYWGDVGDMTYARLANQVDSRGSRYYSAAPRPPEGVTGVRTENQHQRYRR